MTNETINKQLVSIPRPEYPRPDWQRTDWHNLNGQWQFKLVAGEETLTSGDSESQQPLSHFQEEFYEREITVPFSWASPLSGIGENVKGTGWYKRVTDWQPQAAQHTRIFLRFGAVDYACSVWLNQQLVGNHQGGYGSFELDVTAHWNKAGSNTIVVKATDEDHAFQARGKQGYGEIRGIWQTVWLEARPASFIRQAKFDTLISGKVAVALQVEASEEETAKLTFSFDEGKLHIEREVQLTAGMNEWTEQFEVAAPRLWSPEQPELYEGELRLTGSFGEDEVQTYFGIREIGSASFGERIYRWITLNGKPVYLNGTLDQSYHPTGYFTYPSDEEMRQEIFLMKRLGLNFVRIHIKPEEPRKLYWADKLGILVMEDMPCFWGEPDDQARASYEREALEVIQRDWNHPSIFSWVMFNETWGLFTNGMADSLTSSGETKQSFLPETQEWVRSMYHWAKKVDATRLVEDNSPCNWDHVESDLNTWHFYINGYEQVRDHVQEVVDKTFAGSSFNYIGGNVQSDAPLMNSECGNVWGIEGGAGDSDLAWHYRYMMNEFRKHEKLCGFVFTEFRDVTNEFNGYYRLDGTDKDFGYGAYVAGMTLADLHTADFVVIDAPPCETIAAGSDKAVSLLGSSFSDRYHGQALQLRWELWHDRLGTRVIAQAGEQSVLWSGYGTFSLPEITLTMPAEDAVAVFAVTLVAADNEIVTRNFITFDVRSSQQHGYYGTDGKAVSKPVVEYSDCSFSLAWSSLQDAKQSGAEAGSFVYELTLPSSEQQSFIGRAELLFEASAKRVLARDAQGAKLTHHGISMMHGADAQVELNPNTYYMTDETRHEAKVEVWIEGERIECIVLPDDPADSRGVLSWHYQQAANRLEDAGSYGYLCRIALPGRVVAKLDQARTCRIELRAIEGGLTLYGRNAGRYPLDLLLNYHA